MVLNHASWAAVARSDAGDSIREVAGAMISLIQNRTVGNYLRCLDGWWTGAYNDVRDLGAHDELDLLLELCDRAPVLRANVAASLPGCGVKGFSKDDGEPLALCAITDGIAIGLPRGVWDNDVVVFTLEQLAPDGEVAETVVKIDHVACYVHAEKICERRRAALLSEISSFRDLWRQRRSLYPNLLFGMDVEKQISNLSPGHVGIVLRRLANLDRSAREWYRVRSALPQISNVSAESSTVIQDDYLRSQRLHRSSEGDAKLFVNHVKLRNGLRIYVEYCRQSYNIEVGYIGWHLQTARFR